MTLRLKYALTIAVLVVLLVVGLNLGPYAAQIATLAAIYVILASSLNLLLGYSGLLSLGHQAFFGIGAYATAFLSANYELPVVISIIGATLAGAILAWAIGKITLKLRAAFFVIATLAVAEIFRQIALNWEELTGGPMGFAGIPPLGIGGLEAIEPEQTFPVVFVVAAIMVLFVSRLASSDLGYGLRGLAKNENLAKAVGVSTSHHANSAFIIGGAMAASAGALYAHTVGFISPDVFNFSVMVNMLLMAVAGGLGTIAGPVIGAIVFTILPEVLRFSDQWRLVIYGVILLVIVRFIPRGLAGIGVSAVQYISRIFGHDSSHLPPGPPDSGGQSAGYEPSDGSSSDQATIAKGGDEHGHD